MFKDEENKTAVTVVVLVCVTVAFCVWQIASCATTTEWDTSEPIVQVLP